jgi:GST-like protein
MAAYPWLGNIYRGEAYGDAATFLSMHEYEAVGRWVAEIDARPVQARPPRQHQQGHPRTPQRSRILTALPEGTL